MNQPISLRHQVCTVTVMDTTDPDITFNENGVCNYVADFYESERAKPGLEERALATTGNFKPICATVLYIFPWHAPTDTFASWQVSVSAKIPLPEGHFR